MSYRGALAALESYEPKRLRACRMVDDEGQCCALGAISPELREEARRTLAASILSFVFGDLDMRGLTREEAIMLQDVNDAYHVEGGPSLPPHIATPERYEHVLAWLRARVAEEVARG